MFNTIAQFGVLQPLPQCRAVSMVQPQVNSSRPSDAKKDRFAPTDPSAKGNSPQPFASHLAYASTHTYSSQLANVHFGLRVREPIDLLREQMAAFVRARQQYDRADWQQQTKQDEDALNLKIKAMNKMDVIIASDAFDDAIRRAEAQPGLAELDEAMVREAKRLRCNATQIPSDLAENISEAIRDANSQWLKARDVRQGKGDFRVFEPALSRLVELNREKASRFSNAVHPYDVQLNEYEPGLTVAQLDPLFEDLKRTSMQLLKQIKDTGRRPDTSFFGTPNHCPQDRQEQFNIFILRKMGFNRRGGGFSTSSHPFTKFILPPNVVKLTTRYNTVDPRISITGAVHEGGHGLYGQGMDAKLYPRGLAVEASTGWDEGLGRMWENIIGKSLPFWQYFFKNMRRIYQQPIIPGPLPEATHKFYQAMNDVTPGAIRTQADEISYNLHIIMRYEIERDLMNGDLSVHELPQVWNQKMCDYLGVTPKNDNEGILQDIHWSLGKIGYFPLYALGNLYGAQLYSQAKKDLPGLENDIRQGDFSSFRNWLDEKTHQYGRSKTAEQMIMDITGKPLSAKYFTDYLKKKFSDLYGFQPHDVMLNGRDNQRK